MLVYCTDAGLGPALSPLLVLAWCSLRLGAIAEEKLFPRAAVRMAPGSWVLSQALHVEKQSKP